MVLLRASLVPNSYIESSYERFLYDLHLLAVVLVENSYRACPEKTLVN